MSKTIKLSLDLSDDEDIHLGLIRLSQDLPTFELIYKINLLNHPDFKRIDDLKTEGLYYHDFFPRYRTYAKNLRTEIDIIGNHSIQQLKINEPKELFSINLQEHTLLPNHPDVDYIIKASDEFAEFSLILLPQEFTFPIQTISLKSDDRLYNLFQYYE